MILRYCFLVTLLCTFSISAFTIISIKGKVTDGTIGIEGAKVSLVKLKNVSNLTNNNGEFSLIATSSIRHLRNTTIQGLIGVTGNVIHLKTVLPVNHGAIELYTSRGQKVVTLPFRKFEAGDHAIGLPKLTGGLFFMHITLDGSRTTFKLLNTGSELHVCSYLEKKSSLYENSESVKIAAQLLDTIKIEKTGYTTVNIPIYSYEKDSMVIVMIKDNSATKEVSCVVPIPSSSISNYTANAKFPDPFKMKDNTRMNNKNQWCEQRAYLSSLLQATVFGEKPPKPEKVTATFKNNTLSITCEEKGKSISFNVGITLPTSGKAPYPGYIVLGGSGAFGHFTSTPAGCARINYSHGEIAEQTGTSSRGKGKFYTLYGSNHSAGAMMAWAWGVSRILDALEQVPEVKVDPLHCSIIGCSRDGKGAMVCGAFDERIALTLPMEGGSGGISSWRIAKVENGNKSAHPDGCQTAQQIIGENVWLSPNFDQFAKGDINKLPVDAHTLAVMCAPRGVFMVEGSQNSWNCNVCCWTASSAAQMVYEFLGVKDNIGITMYDHGHCSGATAQDKEAYNAFVQRFLFGDTTFKTNYFKHDESFNSLIDFTKWIDWSMPESIN